MFEGLRGFYEPKDRNLINQFLLAKNKLYLFASDEVINAANDFLESVTAFNTGKIDDTERQNRLRKLLFEARKDCLAKNVPSKTDLTLDAFKQMQSM